MSINTWQDLEDFTVDLLSTDNPRKPAGSGSTKKEEDISGQTILVQCKFTDQKNATILKKDLDRLLESSDQQFKFPVFINKSGDNPPILSFSIDYDIEITKAIVKLILIKKKISKLRNYLDDKLTIDVLNKINSMLEKLKVEARNLSNTISSDIEKLDISVEARYADLLNCNLFEGDPNG